MTRAGLGTYTINRIIMYYSGGMLARPGRAVFQAARLRMKLRHYCATDSLVSQLARISAADVFESQSQSGAVDPAIAPLWRPISLCGPAFTVRCVGGDNLAVHHALVEAHPGQVLVVEVTGDAKQTALMGDIIAYAARVRGLAGLVTNGVVRDWAKLQELNFPVFCTGLNIAGPVKADEGERSIDVVVGGAAVSPGDIVLGDEDGVVVVPAAGLQGVVEAAGLRAEKEQEVIRKLDAGATTISLYGLHGESSK